MVGGRWQGGCGGYVAGVRAGQEGGTSGGKLCWMQSAMLGLMAYVSNHCGAIVGFTQVKGANVLCCLGTLKMQHQFWIYSRPGTLGILELGCQSH